MCPDEEYLLPEYRYNAASFNGEIGAVHIDNLFPNKVGHTGDLLIAAQKGDGSASLRWRSYAGANAADTTRDFRPGALPNWRDAADGTPGFIAGLRQSDISADVYWGGGGQIYVSRLTASDFITSEFGENAFRGDAFATMMVPFGFNTRTIATVAASSTNDGDSLFSSDRSGASPTTQIVFTDENFGKSTDQIIDIARQTSLTNPAVVVAKPFATSSEILEFSVPDPIGNVTLSPQFPATTSIRDVFVTNFDSADGELRNQWKLLVLKQERYSNSGGQPALVLFDVDVNLGARTLPEVSEQLLTLPADNTSDTYPPFMVVGNFESTNHKSVRVFHRVSGTPMSTGLDCFTLNINAATHSTPSLPADLAPIACAR